MSTKKHPLGLYINDTIEVQQRALNKRTGRVRRGKEWKNEEKRDIYIYSWTKRIVRVSTGWRQVGLHGATSSGQRALISRCRACIFTIFPACLFLLDVESNRLVLIEWRR